MKKIELTKGYFALVDDEDYRKIINMGFWYAIVNNKNVYACVKKKENNTRIVYFMHRVVMNAPEWMEVDHINHNGCDNRKENLRLCTHRDNTKNLVLGSNNTSGVRGVSYSKTAKKWQSTIKVQSKRIHLGWFSVFEEAVNARKDAEKKYGYFYGRTE